MKKLIERHTNNETGIVTETYLNEDGTTTGIVTETYLNEDGTTEQVYPQAEGTPKADAQVEDEQEGKLAELLKLTKAELMDLAREEGMESPDFRNKTELAEAILENRQEDAGE
jgi:hypothetical protein